jgi:hypothetical protein
VEPEAGDYTVYVNAYSAGNGSTTTGQFYSWVVGQNDTGNLVLDPATINAAPGERFSFEASWRNLESYRWFGAIRYGDSEHRTLITLN